MDLFSVCVFDSFELILLIVGSDEFWLIACFVSTFVFDFSLLSDFNTSYFLSLEVEVWLSEVNRFLNQPLTLLPADFRISSAFDAPLQMTAPVSLARDLKKSRTPDFFFEVFKILSASLSKEPVAAAPVVSNSLIFLSSQFWYLWI